jgi:hypothetical protein
MVYNDFMNPARLVITLFVSLFFFFPKPALAANSYATQSAELSVEAVVHPYPKDFQFQFTSDLTTSAASADQEIEYTITYGSQIDYGTPMTITAEWSLGTVREEYLTNYEILAYVAGSATKDYWGKSAPVVDLINRKITWTITRFPPNTLDKTLRFKLKTPGRYVTDRQVAFSVTARMSTSQIHVGDITLDQLYNPTEFIRQEVAGLRIVSADIRRITDTSFTLFLVTSVPTIATIYYGTDPDNLTMTVTDSLLSDQKTFIIDNLSPATTYYFRILIENEKGIQRKTPESFKVTTAADSLLSLIDQERLLITSQGVPLLPEFGHGGNTILIPTRKEVQFYIPFIKTPPAAVFLALADISDVLGATTALATPSLQKIRLLETQRGIYTGQITTPVTAGRFAVYLEARSPEGWINQDELTKLTVSTPFIITDENNSPVEKALIYIEKYDNISKEFTRFPAESYGSLNPQWSGPGGVVDIILPVGEYRLNVNALGFKTREISYTLLPGQVQTYPIVQLERAPFSLKDFIGYYRLAFIDLVLHLNKTVSATGASYRFLDLGLLTGLSILTVLSTILNLQRLKMTARAAYTKIYKIISKLITKRETATLFVGFVTEAGTDLPLSHAAVVVVKTDGRQTIGRDVTDAAGAFQLYLTPGETYQVTVTKPGYRKTSTMIEKTALLTPPEPIRLVREKRIKLPESLAFLEELIRSLLHTASDLILFGIGIATLWLTLRLGLGKTLLLFLVTATNTLLWLDWQWEKFRKYK